MGAKSVHVRSDTLLDGMRECCQNGDIVGCKFYRRTGDTGDSSNELYLVDKNNNNLIFVRSLRSKLTRTTK